ncbi:MULTISPECIES: LysM peptidoglycan-binding domain-containing C40 family peptidase [Pediococcus]|uniref:Cell wall-associated hydrolase with LysM domain n=2 Tax=Pediococcus pentosaceus TaxID=1255 RepID=Q03F05_PEDPA|nr:MULTISPECIES: LysM peptidoglycan-binding domain-containing protein [Pediococcus]ABJ68217.1 Cell wall-associated hydrolase with LysM domain [Pediococcus pentosaceus ATCC 25745]KAF5441278.1 peptidoglycan endopeptidase [Pediococcus sp. EKM201D]QHM65985.1 putative peptidoglycan endopeptidase LytE [Pediococcus pentosaceus]QHM67704.1 putative peptidoglycan endopeptidase LytE [Pediococcus pentosaceus]QHM68142.1 putative peptidoglycan endopeptidase LytE [Pediococcus pentosaceus]
MVTNSKSNASKLLLAGAAGAGLLVAGGTQVIAHADSVKVQKSDTVWALSQKYGVSVKSIESLNNINQNSHLIFVGQDINIPGKTDSKVTKITVKSGDSLSVLAEKYGVSVNAIMKANNLSSSLIIVGQSLTIPAANGSASQASSTYVPQATQQVTVQASSAAAQTVVTPAPSSAATTYVAPASSAVTSQAVTSVAPSSAVSSAASSVAPSSSAVTSQAATSVAPSSAVSSAASSVAPSSSAVTSQAATSVAPSSAVSSAASSVAPSSSAVTSQAATSVASSSAVSSAASSVAPSSSAVTSQAATSVAPSSAVSSAASSVAPSSSAVTSQAVTSVAPSSAATTPSYATHTSSAATTTNTTNVASSAASSSATTTTTQNTGSVTGLARSLANNTIPYVWGGKTTSGFDCSGFVSYVYQHSAGISLPSYTVAMESYVTKKSVSAAQPGDLLFWGSAGSTYHVAIYLGNNQYANAPTFGQNAKVSTISSYFYPSFAGSVR